MKNKIFVGMMALSLLSTPAVNALGNATVEFTSNDQIQIGDVFTVKMNVTDVKDTYDGIVSLGGNLSFDDTKLEYISSKSVDTPYQFQINEDADYILAGLDFTLDNGIKIKTTIFEFTFKALETGNTTITLKNYKLTDSTDYVDATVIAKQIEILSKNEESVECNIEELNTLNNIEEKKIQESKIIQKIELPKEEKILDQNEELKEEKIEKIENKHEIKEQKNIFIKIHNVISNFVKSIKKIFK